MGKNKSHFRSRSTAASLVAATLVFTAPGALAQRSRLVEELESPVAEHVRQSELLHLLASDPFVAYETAFEIGDELFETQFNVLDGGGANVGAGDWTYTRVPRADLSGGGSWMDHLPARATGPNAAACNECHSGPPTGAGSAAFNVIRDPQRNAVVGEFIQRNTPSLLGSGALQLLAEEMTTILQGIRRQAATTATQKGRPVTLQLSAKGVEFGSITATPVGKRGDVTLDTSAVEGVDDDLVVRPFQWKGVVASMREFTRDAGHNEIGMQAVELVGAGVDGDFDSVTGELTVGDVTAMVIYQVAQPRPTTTVELARLGLIDPLPAGELAAIELGLEVFEQVGCASCHVPSIDLADPVFSEPSQHRDFRDELFPSGADPLLEGVDPALAIRFNLTTDILDNVSPGGVAFGNFASTPSGGARVELFGDLKRHEMGPLLAESIDETGHGASVWLTKELWGVGNSAPYLHNGRALTLTEAIQAHGGEAEASRERFEAADLLRQEALLSFLRSLVLHKDEEE
jgi:hypothetical protein